MKIGMLGTVSVVACFVGIFVGCAAEPAGDGSVETRDQELSADVKESVIQPESIAPAVCFTCSELRSRAARLCAQSGEVPCNVKCVTECPTTGSTATFAGVTYECCS